MLDRTAHRLAAPASRRFIGVKLALEMVALHPLSLLAFFSFVGLANAEPVREIGAQIRRDLPPSLVLEWAMWTPLDVLNFVFVPVRAWALAHSPCARLASTCRRRLLLRCGTNCSSTTRAAW